MTTEGKSLGPLQGVRVMEVSAGLCYVGSGMVGSLPGALLRDLGADVTRVQTDDRFSIDQDIEFAKVWDRGKEVITIPADDDRAWTNAIGGLSGEVDIAIIAGTEELVERIGLSRQELVARNPRLIAARVAAGVTREGHLPDTELLLHARTGMLTQFRPHRPGPAFVDLTIAGAGAALSVTVGALACLLERESSSRGGWIETSMYAGMQALLGMVLGRVENPSASTNSLWGGLGPSMAPYLRCSDGRYIQLWFGAKGAYESFLEKIGDPPSTEGYESDSLSGAIAERSVRWAELFAGQDQSYWVNHLSDANFRCEPVLRPGEALREDYARQNGLTTQFDDSQRGAITALGPVISCLPVGNSSGKVSVSGGVSWPRLCEGIRVVDLSAYLAGPVTTHILAELGADVIKVEPTTGDVHRSVEFMFAAGQRGKRAIGLDLKCSQSEEVLERLFKWADVVHHNARIGLAERLGYDEASVRRVNADIVYNHSTGFGSEGPQARLPSNDHLIQALSGVEAAAGGDGQPPSYVPWGAIDSTGGWLGAVGILAGLYARRRQGVGQSVRSSLLGSGMTLKSGSFCTADTRVEGPILGSDQTGYGATYRIYQGSDGKWFAMVILDIAMWDRLRALLESDELPTLPPALRTGQGEPKQVEEEILERVFRMKAAAVWVDRLAAASIAVELVLEVDRLGFIQRLFDDPVSRRQDRVVSFAWGDRGLTEQPGFPLVMGPAPRPEAPAEIPKLGEHTSEVLEMLGFTSSKQMELRTEGAIL